MYIIVFMCCIVLNVVGMYLFYFYISFSLSGYRFIKLQLSWVELGWVDDIPTNRNNCSFDTLTSCWNITLFLVECLALIASFWVCSCSSAKTNLQADESRDSGSGMMSRVTRKHVIIGVTCAVVIAMVIAGVLVGVKFHLDSTSELVTVSSSQQFHCFNFRNIWVFSDSKISLM